MSSSSGEQQEEQASEAEAPESEEGATESLVETAQCPNCGRVFTGNYCPECGQEADPSVSATGVIGGFFRELVDVEHGFWPTFVGLTLRPGKTLRQYLGGVRKGLTSPGRYLLAAVVILVGARQLGRWIGAKPPPVVDPYMTGKSDAFEAATGYFVSAAEQAPLFMYLSVAAPLALSLWTLFRDRFNQEAEALAVGSFVVGHTLLLTKGARLAFSSAGDLLTAPSIELPGLTYIVFVIAYVGIACWGCFGPGWKPALKGAFGGAWAWVDFLAVLGIGATIAAVWLGRAYPGAYYVFSPEETTVQWGLPLFIAGVFSVPLLLHAGMEAYYRLR